MSKLRGRPLHAINRAEFEAMERRIEDRELARHLDRYDDEPPDDEEPPHDRD